MPNGLQHLLKGLVSWQIWIALCAWASAASAYHWIYKAFLPCYCGLMVMLFTWTAYLSYYANNPSYPSAKFAVLPVGLSALCLYSYYGYPKPLFMLLVCGLSVLYLLPIKWLNPKFKILRWGILSIIWTIFPFFFCLNQLAPIWSNSIYFGFRFFFIANLCFIFFIKDESRHFSKNKINHIKLILMIGQYVSVLAIFIFSTLPLTLGLLFITWLTQRAYIKQNAQNKSPYFYSMETDGLMILESIFVQSLNSI